MFSSDRFQEAYYEGQRDFVTYCAIIVIVFSVVYYVAVVVAEISAGSDFMIVVQRYLCCCLCPDKERIKQKNIAKRRAKGEHVDEESDDEIQISLSSNPLMMRGDPESQKKAEAEAAAATEQLERMRQQMYQLKKDHRQNVGGKKKGGRKKAKGRKGQMKKNRKAMGVARPSKKMEEDMDTEIELTSMPEKVSEQAPKQVSEQVPEQLPAATSTKTTVEVSAVPISDSDSSSLSSVEPPQLTLKTANKRASYRALADGWGRTYYQDIDNPATTTWELPKDSDITEDATEASYAAAVAKKESRVKRVRRLSAVQQKLSQQKSKEIEVTAAVTVVSATGKEPSREKLSRKKSKEIEVTAAATVVSATGKEPSRVRRLSALKQKLKAKKSKQ